MAKHYQTTVVSSIGTSILTNKAGQQIDLLKRTANYKTPAAFDAEARIQYEAHVTERRARILDGDQSTVRDLSAELNGILALELPLEETCHLLFCTDTVQGRATAEIVKAKLDKMDVRSSEICVLDGMTTSSQEDFSKGVDTLLNLCEARLRPLREGGDKILFNLVGGFKSLQAYLQMLGMIYADEICYLFEAPGSPLLRIPRLPLHFDIEPLRQSAALVARLASSSGVIVAKEKVSTLPSVYVEVAGSDAVLNVWGRFVWNSEKEKLLSGDLLEHPGLRYEPSFLKDYEHCKEPRQRAIFQETIAKAAVLWQDGKLAALRKDGGLQYENLQNRDGIGHFRVGQGPRISCLPEGEILSLRHMGAHDYVNDNP